MKLTTVFFGLSFAIFSALVMAGNNHDHGHSHAPVDQATAKVNATKAVAALIKNQKLEKSWGTVTASTVEEKVFKGNKEWVVIFLNEKVTDSSKRKLYVFLTLSGDYLAANHTGE